jgi:hypothetical protein
MVITYWARQFPKLLAAAAQDTERINDLLPATTKGIKGRELKTFLEARGFTAFIFTGEPGDLRHHVEKGRPVVICLGPKGSGGPLHYAVVVGIDEQGVWLNDSARGKLIRDDLARFLAAWKVTDNWALLAVPSETK